MRAAACRRSAADPRASQPQRSSRSRARRRRRRRRARSRRRRLAPAPVAPTGRPDACARRPQLPARAVLREHRQRRHGCAGQHAGPVVEQRDDAPSIARPPTPVMQRCGGDERCTTDSLARRTRAAAGRPTSRARRRLVDLLRACAGTATGRRRRRRAPTASASRTAAAQATCAPPPASARSSSCTQARGAQVGRRCGCGGANGCPGRFAVHCSRLWRSSVDLEPRHRLLQFLGRARQLAHHLRRRSACPRRSARSPRRCAGCWPPRRWPTASCEGLRSRSARSVRRAGATRGRSRSARCRRRRTGGVPSTTPWVLRSMAPTASCVSVWIVFTSAAIWRVASAERSASRCTSSATTEKPRPASPADAPGSRR